MTIDRWQEEFDRANTEEGIGIDPDFVEFTDPELLCLFVSWFSLQLGSLFNRAVLESSCLPDLEGGITVIFDAPEEEMFPILCIDVNSSGYINVCRVGTYADTNITSTINNLEVNPAIALLVEEFV